MSSAAFFFTDSIPFSAADFDSYISLERITCPLLALRLKKYFPFDDVFSSNLPAIIYLPPCCDKGLLVSQVKCNAVADYSIRENRVPFHVPEAYLSLLFAHTRSTSGSHHHFR